MNIKGLPPSQPDGGGCPDWGGQMGTRLWRGQMAQPGRGARWGVGVGPDRSMGQMWGMGWCQMTKWEQGYDGQQGWSQIEVGARWGQGWGPDGSRVSDGGQWVEPDGSWGQIAYGRQGWARWGLGEYPYLEYHPLSATPSPISATPSPYLLPHCPYLAACPPYLAPHPPIWCPIQDRGTPTLTSHQSGILHSLIF